MGSFKGSLVGAVRNSKGSRGRSQVLPWNKNITRAKIFNIIFNREENFHGGRGGGVVGSFKGSLVGAVRNSKGSRGRSQVLPWNKNITRAKIVFSKPCS